jgi:N-methylhydantoinase A
MPVHRHLAVAAVADLASDLALGLMETAQGILSVVTANMARAIRVISVQRGYDPRDYTLVAFGGAGPLHAVRLAAELEIGRVLVPVSPGILCAMGLLLTDLRTDFALTRLTVLDEAAKPVLAEAVSSLKARATTWFEAEGVALENRRVVCTVDMRYAGQNYELPIALPSSEDPISALAAAFAAAHQRQYGFSADDEAVQLVTFRVEASAIVPKARFAPSNFAGTDPTGALIGHRSVWLPEIGGAAEVPVYDRARLGNGNRLTGPAIVEQMDATTLILPGWTGHVEPYGNLILEFER